jgi:hypothetical protein
MHDEKKDILYYDIVVESIVYDPKIKKDITCMDVFMFSPQDWNSFYSKYVNHFKETDNYTSVNPHIACITNCVIINSHIDIHGPFIYSLQIDSDLYYNAFALRKMIN